MVTRAGGRQGTPGHSAVRGYRQARRLRRRRRVEVGSWLLLAGAAGLGALLGGPPRWCAGLAVAAVIVAVWRRPQPDPERWRRGAAGEVATAALLERLGRRRFAVLHDRGLPGTRANVDHLVIGRRGVWVLDSKAFRAPVEIRRRRVRVGDRRLDVAAVRWEASVVADHLGVDVRPLVVVHGGGGGGRPLPRRGRRCDGVRVLPADGLVRHLRRARTGSRRRRADVVELAARAALVLPER
jgi:hypothetical protein